MARATSTVIINQQRIKQLTRAQIQALEMTAEALSPILNMSKEKLMELLSKDLYQVELRPGGYGISEVIKAKIEKLELPGIDFIKNSKKRYYNK